jgi:hypothetical protein
MSFFLCYDQSLSLQIGEMMAYRDGIDANLIRNFQDGGFGVQFDGGQYFFTGCFHRIHWITPVSLYHADLKMSILVIFIINIDQKRPTWYTHVATGKERKNDRFGNQRSACAG